MGTDIVTYQLRQRDHLLQVARAMSARLEPSDVLGVVVRSAVGMTGGRAGAIAIREDRTYGLFEGERAPRLDRGSGPPLRIVASYHLDERYVDYVGDAVRSPDVTNGVWRARPDTEAVSVAIPRRTSKSGDVDPFEPTGSTGSTATPPSGSLARWYQDNPLDKVDDSVDGPRRVLTIPLELRGETIGQIVVLRDGTATIFSPLDEDLLRAFADQAAVAIQNALLHSRVRRNERQLAAVVQDSAAGILLLDEQGIAVAINPAAERFLGRSATAGVGLAVGDLILLEDDVGRPVPLTLPTAPDGTATPRGRLVGDTVPVDAERWVQVSVTPQLEDMTNVEGYVVTVTDLTAWREAERAKSAFLAGLSHELKTPLALIRGFAETLANPQMSHEEGFHSQAFNVILDETARLTDIVDRLLLAARLQAGEVRLRLDVVDIGDLLQRLVGDLRLTVPEREIEVGVNEGLSTITADAERLREVFAELIRNALKYAPPEEPIRVIAARYEGLDFGLEGVRVSVIDRGQTISQMERDRIFERFYRGDERGEGTGLGLFMARAIARAHGGDVLVGRADGDGNQFDVILPASPPEPTR